MKKIIIHILFFTISTMYSQDIEQKILSNNKITKKIISGFEYKNDSLIKHTYFIEEFDKFGNTISFTKYDLNHSIIKQTKYNLSNDGTTEFGEIYDKNGNLKYSMITIKNKEKRSIRKMQINSNNDTLNEQIWIRDKNLNDSVLYRVKNGKRTIIRNWNYNQGNMLTSEKRYDGNGNLILKETYTYQIDGNCIKKRNSRNKIVFHKCKKANQEIVKFLTNSEGYLAGIKLVSEKGGEKIETKLENGLTEKIEYFSKKGKLLAEIKYKYEKSK